MTDTAIQPPPPAAFFLYLPSYRVLVCTVCRYAIQPHGIPRHLKEIHSIYRSRRRPYIEHAAKFDLAAPQDVIQTPITDFPVRPLPVLDGLRCLEASGCTHLCLSTKRMRNHWLMTHGRQALGSGADWEPAPLQTFFKGNLIHYFTDPALQNSKCGGIKSVISVGKKPASPSLQLQLQNLTTCLGPFDAMDKELLQHYLASTYLTFVDRHGTEAIWHQTIPQIAAEHPFLMSTLLACTALHAAYKFPSRRKAYLLRAHCLQDAAMPLFRDAIVHVNERNCHAVLVFSHLLIIYSLAADRSDEFMLLTDPSSPEPHLMCSWLYFIRNGCLLVCDYWEHIENGPLGSLVSCWEMPIVGADALSSKLGVASYLVSLIPEHAVPHNENAAADRELWSEATRKTYCEAAIQLSWAIAASQVLDGDQFTTWDAVRIWPMTISTDFVDLLADNHPGALILLGHYCGLLERLQAHWYFEGRATTLRDRVMERLDKKWHRCINIISPLTNSRDVKVDITY